MTLLPNCFFATAGSLIPARNSAVLLFVSRSLTIAHLFFYIRSVRLLQVQKQSLFPSNIGSPLSYAWDELFAEHIMPPSLVTPNYGDRLRFAHSLVYHALDPPGGPPR
jgi:hypothetical protein